MDRDISLDAIKLVACIFVCSLYNEGKVHETTHHFLTMFSECCVCF